MFRYVFKDGINIISGASTYNGQAIVDFAEREGTTPRTLSRLFSQDLALSPKQVLTKYRIQEACRLLKNSRMSITDIAFESGFGSLSNFSKLYIRNSLK